MRQGVRHESDCGVVTFVSRGTDDDAHGVLAGFGLTGDVSRSRADDGWDVVTVTLQKSDLARIPESGSTALEASLSGGCASGQCERLTTSGDSRIAGAACAHVSNMLNRLAFPDARASPARSQASSGHGGSISFGR